MVGWLKRATGAIAGFFSGAGSTVGRLISDAIQAVFDFLIRIIDAVGGAWDWMGNGVEWFTRQLEHWAGAVFDTLAHILGTVIPNAISKAFHDATRWAAHAIDWLHKHVIRPIDRFLHDVWRWIQRRVHDIERFANHTWRELSKILDWFWRAARHAVDLVLHPGRLLVWLLEAVTVTFLWAALHVLIPIAAAVLRNSRQLAAHVLPDLEALIADLL